MAGNEVEIVVTSKDKSGPGLAGANEQVSRFRRAVRDTGSAADESAGKVKGYGDHVDRLAERADNSERNLIGLHDVVDGTAAIMAGPGKQGIVAYIQGWADLTGGLAPLIPMLKGLSKQVVTNTVNSIRNGAVQTALAIKTKALAVAQAILNAVMAANPILLVVLAIAALVAIFIVAYKRSETFRRIVQAAFNGVKDAASALWSGIRTAFHGITSAGDAVIDFFRRLPGRVVGFFRDLPGKLRDLGSGLIRAFVDGMKAVGGLIISTLTSLIPGPIKSFLHLGSPAKQGPMSEDGGPEHWGEKVATYFTRGLVRGAGGVPGAVSGLTPSRPTAGGAGLGAAGGGPIVLYLDVGGRRLAEVLIDPLRKEVRSLGGDVQAVLGT